MVVSSMVSAQSEVEFIETGFDFGSVKEDGGKITNTFLFINTGTSGVKVESVETTCGCTTPDWSSDIVLPLDTGYIVASYDPYNRPGKFEKQLDVRFVGVENDQLEKQLLIEGEVLPKPKSIEEELPLIVGSVRVKYKTLNVGKITTEKAVKSAFEVYNDSDSILVWLSDKESKPSHIIVNYLPDTLMPRTKGEVVVTYDSQKKSDFGYVSDNLKLYTNESDENEKEFHVIATITEFFEPMSDLELEKAPSLVFDKTQHNYGSIDQGSTAKAEFTLTNNGLQPLNIRKIKTNCECVKVRAPVRDVKPGDSTSIEVVFDTTAKQGRQYKTITVFSNDPSSPTQMVSIKALIN